MASSLIANNFKNQLNPINTMMRPDASIDDIQYFDWEISRNVLLSETRRAYVKYANNLILRESQASPKNCNAEEKVFAFVMYNTECVRMYSDGRKTFTCGGNASQTTRRLMSRVLPFRFFVRGAQLYIGEAEGTCCPIVSTEVFTITPEGNILREDGSELPNIVQPCPRNLDDRNTLLKPRFGDVYIREDGVHFIYRKTSKDEQHREVKVMQRYLGDLKGFLDHACLGTEQWEANSLFMLTLVTWKQGKRFEYNNITNPQEGAL